jgi:flagellar biosynthesis anti-sigma factor FlgM
MIKGINNNSTFISTISSKQNNAKIENVEKSKVEEIKESIKNGTYKIDLDQTASKMAKSLL